MKRSSLFLLGGMAASLMACSGRIEPTSARVVDPVRHYYPMVAGDRLTIAYEIENTGSNPLVISEIQTSCGCLAYDEGKRIIPAGDKDSVVFSYDSGKNHGRVEHQIRLYGNFESQSVMLLEFNVEVVPRSEHTQDYEETVVFGHPGGNDAAREERGDRPSNYYVDGEY